MEMLKRVALPALLLAHGAAAAVPLAHVMNPAGGNTIAFNAISTTPTVAASNSFRATTGASINGVAVTLSGYSVLARSGFVDTNGAVLGALMDKNMQPIYTINDTAYYPMKTCLGALCPTNGTPYMQNTLNNAIPPAGAYFASCPGGAVAGCATAGPSSFADVSNDPDYMSMLSVGGNLYSVIHFETIPAAMYMMQLNMAANGELSVTPGSLTAIDWSASGGILNPCAGSTTPWQSHLGSEESVGLDGRDFAGTFLGVTSLSGYNTVSINSTSTSGVPVIMRYFGVYPNTLTPAVVVQNLQPYNYGYINEVVVTGPGAYTTKKHYAMGRTPWEMAYIMPDNKTVYGASDKTNGMFNKFVSNTAGDLSSGTLYCAAMTQTSAANAGSFTINWLSMGALSDATIAGWVGATANATVAAGLSFDDIFVTDLPTGNVTGACNAGFISVNTGYSYKVAGVTYYNECLKLNPANPNAAAQAAAVESLRYAAMIGCTTEFNKWEGITYSPKRKQLYTAMSYWTSAGMLASTTSSGAVNTGDIGGSQDIALAAQPCGCVYYLNVDATYSATDMSALVCGTAQTADAQGNTCSVNSIASPDNVIMMDDFDTLIIGEDTGSHRIDYIWQYAFPNVAGSGSPVNGTLTAIMSTMLGAETTSPYWHSLNNGFGYLLAVIQHPYGDSDNAYGALPTSSGVAGYVGYVGPIPTTKAAALAAGTSSGASSVAVSVSLLLALLALLV